MRKLKEHPKAILAGLLLIVGVCCVLFGKSVAVQCGITCIVWGVDVFVLAWIANGRNLRDCEEFDMEAREILTDIAEKGTSSEYYMFYDFDKINKLKSKMIKKQRKQVFSFVTMGIVLIVVAFSCFF